MDPDHLAGLPDAESRAMEVLLELHPGSSVLRRDFGNGTQIHDFDLIVHGETVAVEVTEAAIPGVRSADAARRRHTERGTIPAPSLTRSWHVYPTPATRFGTLARRLPPLLAQLEAKGKDRFFFATDAGDDPVVLQIANDCAVEFGVAWPNLRPPQIVVGLAGDDRVWVEQPLAPAAHLTDAVEIEAWNEGNIRKLTRADGSSRHLFVWIGSENYLPWKDLDFGKLPLAPPRLPPGVDTVWVAGVGAGTRPIIWSAVPHGAWADRSSEPLGAP